MRVNQSHVLILYKTAMDWNTYLKKLHFTLDLNSVIEEAHLMGSNSKTLSTASANTHLKTSETYKQNNNTVAQRVRGGVRLLKALKIKSKTLNWIV